MISFSLIVKKKLFKLSPMSLWINGNIGKIKEYYSVREITESAGNKRPYKEQMK